MRTPRKAMAWQARRKVTSLPDYPPHLEKELEEAEKAFDDFLDEFQKSPLKWGLNFNFDNAARPYMDRIASAHQAIRDCRDNPEKYLSSGLLAYAYKLLKPIILSEQQSKHGKRAKGGNYQSEDGLKWDNKRIAEVARKLGYAASPDKQKIVRDIVSRSGKSESTVRRAIKNHGLSKVYRGKKPI